MNAQIDRITTLYPVDVPRYRNIASVVSDLAPAESLYCFSPATLQRRITLFRKYFPGTLSFAVKANNADVVLSHMGQFGVSVFDVASLTEIRQIRKLIPGARLLYDNPIKSEQEITEAYFSHGVRSFCVDDVIEFEKISNIIGADRDVQLTVRFTMDNKHAVQELGSKFGTDGDSAADLLRRIDAAGYQTALMFHPGSQCIDPIAYVEHIALAAEIVHVAGVEIGMLNVGGGFPGAYLDCAGPELKVYFERIKEEFLNHFSFDRCELVCEPGRGLVVNCCALLCHVKHRRSNDVLFLNDGAYGGFMERWMTAFELPLRVYRDGKVVQGETMEFQAYGPTCCAGDNFRKPLKLPRDIAIGDWIAFGMMGAYGSSSTTNFNGYTSNRYVIVDELN